MKWVSGKLQFSRPLRELREVAKDELLWAATWLFEATDDQYYLKYVMDNSASLGGTGWAVREFSWDNKYAGLQVLLTKVLMEGVGDANNATLKQYQAKAEFFICACLQKNNGYNAAMTPGGLLYFNEWNNVQYVSSASFLMAVYSDYLSMANGNLYCPDGQIQHLDLLKFAQSQKHIISWTQSGRLSDVQPLSVEGLNLCLYLQGLSQLKVSKFNGNRLIP